MVEDRDQRLDTLAMKAIGWRALSLEDVYMKESGLAKHQSVLVCEDILSPYLLMHV